MITRGVFFPLPVKTITIVSRCTSKNHAHLNCFPVFRFIQVYSFTSTNLKKNWILIQSWFSIYFALPSKSSPFFSGVLCPPPSLAGIRNVTDIAMALREAHRVLRPVGDPISINLFSWKILTNFQTVYKNTKKSFNQTKLGCSISFSVKLESPKVCCLSFIITCLVFKFFPSLFELFLRVAAFLKIYICIYHRSPLQRGPLQRIGSVFASVSKTKFKYKHNLKYMNNIFWLINTF